MWTGLRMSGVILILRLKFEIKSLATGSTVRFAYGQVNSTTYPSATRLYDDLRVHAQTSPGLYTLMTDTTVTLLTNAHAQTVINFAATQLTHTLTLPATPVDGQEVIITFNSAVTNLTIGGNSTTLRGTAPTTAAIGARLIYRYYGTLASPAWIREIEFNYEIPKQALIGMVLLCVVTLHKGKPIPLSALPTHQQRTQSRIRARDARFG